ncbi:LCP family protein [Clostridium sp. UBA5988]|uniref:LCP family protein n=1 Tax=Clostridium sp. UBA5988 TaxID=1946369 RepID=UPI0032174328
MSTNSTKPSSTSKKRQNRNKRKKKKANKIILIIITLLVLFITIAVTYGLSTLGKLNTVDFKNKDLGIDKSNPKSSSDKIKNVVLFGIDQSEGDVGRSDAIIIATVDSKHKKLKLTSLSRDSYVNIDGHGYDKLNHAYAYGKEELAIKTINQNFGLDITDYAKVNFSELEEIIDIIGGIELTIDEAEVEYINNYVRDLSNDQGITPQYVNSSGVQTLNGLQATAYSRIRATSGGDDKRTERHRAVLTALFNKVQNLGILKLPSVINEVLPHVQTSLSTSEILSLGTKVLTSGMTDIEQLRFPLAEHSKGDSIDGVYYTTFDEEVTKEQIQKYIYEDIKPETSSN